jgi:hypothetical protein
LDKLPQKHWVKKRENYEVEYPFYILVEYLEGEKPQNFLAQRSICIMSGHSDYRGCQKLTSGLSISGASARVA